MPTVAAATFDFVVRSGISYGRLTAPEFKGVVRPFVQLPLSPNDPAEVKQKAVALMHERLWAIVAGRKNK